VDAIGDFVSCFHCSLEFTVDEPTVDEPTVDEPTVDETVVIPDEPKKRKSIWFFLTNFRWSKIKWFKLFVGGFLVIFNLAVIAVFVLLLVNIILWIFLPLMVYSIKQSLEETVREIKKLNNI
jgi:hypothetical protein